MKVAFNEVISILKCLVTSGSTSTEDISWFRRSVIKLIESGLKKGQ